MQKYEVLSVLYSHEYIIKQKYFTDFIMFIIYFFPDVSNHHGTVTPLVTANIVKYVKL